MPLIMIEVYGEPDRIVAILYSFITAENAPP